MNTNTMELLAPAGGFDQLRYAIHYGADAVYLGCDRYGLRARATNFSLEDLPKAVAYAHERGVKVHVTCNVLMKDSDFAGLGEYAKAIETSAADAVIVSDLGAMQVIKQNAPGLEIHVSTQASCANAQSALVWQSLGASRIVCAREMNLKDIARMRSQIPDDLEIETFVHGAMCMSVSGRCVISDHLCGRAANKGACTQPCRWKYYLMEETRPGEYFKVEEDEAGSYLFNSKDMNMLMHLNELRDAGVNSIKIEGRNKKAFYVASVVNAYRQVLDGADPRELAEELEKISHRPYGTGFYFGMAAQERAQGGQTQSAMHVATVKGSTKLDDGTYLVEVMCQNRMRTTDTIEILSPRVPVRTQTVGDIWWQKNPEYPDTLEPVESANRSKEIYFFKSPYELKEYDLIRIDEKLYRMETPVQDEGGIEESSQEDSP